MSQNRSITLITRSARTTGDPVSSAAITNRLYKGVRVKIYQSAGTGSQSVVPTIEAYDADADTWTAILTGAAITSSTTAEVLLVVYPGCVAVNNLVANLPIGYKWRLTLTPADTKSSTIGATADLLI